MWMSSCCPILSNEPWNRSDMKQQSRRQFVKSCLYLILSGISPMVFPWKVAGRRDESTLQEKGGAVFNRGGAARIDPDFEPPYVGLHRSGELKKRGEELWALMQTCCLCPRQCGINRLSGDRGFCGSAARLEISAYHPHFGEERPLVGRGGSGTVFFTHCGLRCVFCINWQTSQGGVGEVQTVQELADMMLHLQKMGCHNINVVTPTHYSAHIVLAMDRAAAKGLRLPLVYNTCGWERLEIVKMLDGIVDIYLPDFKYADGQMAAKYSSEAEDYPEVTKAALLEMNRQVGVARPAPDGLMYRGLMIRHLVMPNGVSGTREVIRWVAEHLPKDTYFNLMSQYRPMYKAHDYPKIARRGSREEYADAVRWTKETGLTNLEIQGMPL